MGVFIPGDKLSHLKEYKYKSDDRSLLTKFILKKFWVKFECIFPLWMAPNMVTLSGLFFIIGAVLLVFYYDPHLNQPSPWWTYLVYAAAMFFYQTFDACDGIHARKTGQSGPLGELFDHCIDAINTTLSVIVFGSVYQLGWGWKLWLAQFATLCNFYLSTWEEFHTHQLYLSYFSGPVEGIWLLIFFYCLTAYLGAETWSSEAFVLDLSAIDLSSEFPVSMTDTSFAGGAVMLIYNIYSAWSNAMDYHKTQAGKFEASKGLLPFFVFYASNFALLLLEPTIIQKMGFAVVITIGSTIAFAVGRIIIAHLTKQSFPLINAPMFIPLIQYGLINVLTKVYGLSFDLVIGPIVWCGLGLALGLHAWFVVDIVYDITSYLDIWALTIKHKKVE
ncbi:unnamed protein product [Kuraishia capsulata CBS 1993]|uniref:Uncharacterized protein n=1 Tax=Kuraishia capsulata CBS 1993 TaxID=1382522 RepID=W6MJ63_9ASCO|nr:uncharacterized protein KUCA_T00000430001 [Kuraishia capsulata CBS 1993]CDK24467.1 unnamed protein product [Kuraishia capsulata CBS 1993]